MWENTFRTELPLIVLFIRALFVYGSLLLLLRVSGKKQLGQLNASELLTMLLISEAVSNSLSGGDNSLLAGLISAAVLIGLSSLLDYLSYRNSTFSKLLEGTPTLVIHHGKFLRKNMKKEQLSEEELLVLLRKQGIEHVSHVKSAILEADGELSVFKS